MNVAEAFAIATEHHAAGRLQWADEIYRRILAVEPEHAEAHHLRGVVACRMGQYEAAVEHIQRAIALRPAEAAYHNDLGLVFEKLGKADQAQGRLYEAIAWYRRAIEHRPRSATYHQLGVACSLHGDLGGAVAAMEQAVTLDPQNADAYRDLGIARTAQRDFKAAASAFARGAALDPESSEAHRRLGTALTHQGNLDAAAACFERALALDPQSGDALDNLGAVYTRQGELDKGLTLLERAVRLKPDSPATHSNYLCALRCRPGVSAAAMRDACAAFGQRHAPRVKRCELACADARSADRRMRLGFSSPAFQRGPVGSFLIRALENLDRAAAELYCYSDTIAPDEVTARFVAASDVWRDVAGLGDEELAECIRADRVDILFDLTGHASPNRILLFARKPAPVQITWIDSVGTTGLEAIDYLLADEQLVPPGAEANYVEKVLRLPGVYVCYDPAREAPPVGPLPAGRNGQVTFGSFNRAEKIHAGVVEVWSEILRRVPGSRLLLKHGALGGPGVQQRFRGMFAARGVEAERVEFQGFSPVADYCGQYNRVDVALDPFPHNGGVVTCDALWMGVPVVTCPGETFASRQALTHLSSVGLAECVARDLDDYVDIAVSLAQDLPRLAAIRAGLRVRMAASPLCDGPRFAQSFLALVRDVWRCWTESVRAF